jgi:hypothetical protein
MEINGLLYSQIGYDLKDPMRALIRSTNPEFIIAGTSYVIQDCQTGEGVFQGEVRRWGELWKSNWWEMDFSVIDQPGEYQILVKDGEHEILHSDPFKVGQYLLWKETIPMVVLDQLEERERLARNGNGWKDCGSYWREVNSHATMVIGLCDLLNLGFESLESKDIERLVRQITVGCDYIGICQDKSKRLGHPEGAIIHEIPNHISIIPGDIAQSTVAFAKASRLLADILPDKSDEYLARAVKAFEYLIYKARPYGSFGFSHWNHGAPDNFNVPNEWMTRDLTMMLWGGVELWIAGKTEFQEVAVRLAREIRERQISATNKEGDYYGHFRTFKSCNFSEKANVHHHFGHDTGGTFPHYIMPLFEMVKRWYDHPDEPLWREMIHDFAYGYFLPACSKNPFYLIPEGYFAGEGLLFFCGPWHGINTTIGFASTLASKLELFTGDSDFRNIAIGNLQWIAGLNAGITRDSFKGCFVWQETIEPGRAEPYSQIVGFGRKHVGAWTKIKGTIPNGFNVNPQFQLTVKPDAAADGPWLYTDEDWIPHVAGWISALSHLRDLKHYSD